MVLQLHVIEWYHSQISHICIRFGNSSLRDKSDQGDVSLPVIEVSFSTKSSTPWANTLIAVEIWEMRLLSDVSKLTPLKNRKKCGTVLSEPNIDTT